MSALVELAERCEKATGPDRKLDVLIALAVRAAQLADGYTPEQVFGRGCHAYNGLAYTASLDAVMTLVPEGWKRIESTSLSYTDGTKRHYAAVNFMQPSKAATPALALCAAALRARAGADQ